MKQAKSRMEEKKAPHFFILSLVFVILSCLLSTTIAITAAQRNQANGICSGSIAECQEDEEFLLDSDTHRRILAATINNHVFDPNKPACWTERGKPSDCSALNPGVKHRTCPIYNGCGKTGDP